MEVVTTSEKWEWVKLGDAVQVLDNLRKPINSTERQKRINGKRENALFPYYGATGQVGWIDDFITEGEYILVGEDGAPFLDYFKDKAYKIKGKTWVNNHAHILKEQDGISINDFILHYLNSINYRSYVNGTTRLKLTKGNLVEIPFPIPPVEIQQQIVSKIEALFSELEKGIEELKTAQQQLKIYRQAVLKWAFEGRLTNEGLKQGELPKGWKNVMLSEVGTLFCGQSSSVSEVNKEGRGMLYVTGPEQWNGKNIDRIKWTEFPKRMVPDGSIFITVKGAGVGKLFPGVACAIGRDVYAYLPSQKLNFKFCYYALKYSVDLIVMHAQGDIPGLTKNHILDHQIGICLIYEQQRVVEEIERRLSVCNHIEETINKNLNQTEALRQSILKKAFEGNLK